jgi:serine/threonine protein kinase
MLMSPPAQLGFEYYDLKDYELQRVLGCGAQSTVFAVTRKGEDNTEYALKVFKDDKDHIRELNVLAQLKKDGFTVAVPLLFDDGSEVEITEIVSKKKHKGIVSMPVCKLIRPERDGELLSAKNVLSLIDVLKSLHEAEIFNCDLKPKNVLLGTDGPVICDWGSAVIGRKRVCSPGTIGFCDFAIGSKQNACAEHDLKALVRLFYACYTNQHVPSNSLFDSNAFWSVQFPVGSYWQKAMDAAGAADYDKLKSILGQF